MTDAAPFSACPRQVSVDYHVLFAATALGWVALFGALPSLPAPVAAKTAVQSRDGMMAARLKGREAIALLHKKLPSKQVRSELC